MDYVMLMGRPEDLNNKINEHLADGWELHGTIIIQPMQSILIQPMVRKSVVKKKAVKKDGPA